MIGNDIVDLVQARFQSNWKRKGFVQKIFTQKEQELIFHPKILKIWFGIYGLEKNLHTKFLIDKHKFVLSYLT